MVGPDPLKPIACLTYQGLCDIEDPETVLGRLAQSRWADERAVRAASHGAKGAQSRWSSLDGQEPIDVGVDPPRSAQDKPRRR